MNEQIRLMAEVCSSIYAMPQEREIFIKAYCMGANYVINGNRP